jgi:hypothetical protein
MRYQAVKIVGLLAVLGVVGYGYRANTQGLPAGLPLRAAEVSPASSPVEGKKDAPMTPQQAKELFRSVTEILHFVSDDTHLAVRQDVKRRLITRKQVEKYILDKFHGDKDAKHMEREEIVLKKFGLLDRDFQLKPFLVSLLTEQIAGFYDNKTKTVNLLDWVMPDWRGRRWPSTWTTP